MRLHTVFLAPVQVVVNGNVKLPHQTIHVGSLESDYRIWSRIDGLSVQDSHGVIVLNLGDVCPVLHHGCTPTAARSLAIARTVA